MMNALKIIFTGLFLLLFQSKVSGQAFKLDELAAFNTMDMASFKAEIKNNQYKFYDKIESADYHLYEYESPDYTYKIAKFEYTGEKADDRIEFSFKSKKDFDVYSKAVLAAGYKQTEKGKIITGENYLDYFKGKSQIRIVQPKTAQDTYTILVFK